jgi:cation diffusion facilitator CzcD-associated flavoprotein CzcO
MSRTDPRLAILGAGPIGLEAALYAAALKLPFTVYERGRPGEHLRQWGHVRLFSPFGMNSTPLGKGCLRDEAPRRALPGDGDLLTGREHVAAYLEPLAATPPLRERLQTETTVLHVGRRGFLKEDGPGDPRRAAAPFVLLVRGGDGKERLDEADVVLDCTGTYGRPRWLGEGGIPAPGELAARANIAWGLEDILGEKRGDYADRTTLVVGAGHSAATTVCLLARLAEGHHGTWIVWLARGAGSQPLRRVVNDPLRERDGVAARANMLATRGEGNVEFHPQSVVEAIEGGRGTFKVRARCGGAARTWEVDRIIGNVGYTPDTDLYRELQVHECHVSLAPSALAAALREHRGDFPAQPAALRNPEPNFFILGAKSYGRGSTFLLRAGFEQVRQVFTLISGKAGLDLYRKR